MAGGSGLRLGREKAFERINQQTLIERTIDCLSPVSQAIIIVTSQEQSRLVAGARLRGEVIVDVYPGGAALGGIFTGLVNADTLHSLVVGCDMPFLSRALLQHLIGLAPGFDVVVPRTRGLTEPLHAVYSKRCLVPIEQLLNQGGLAISRLFSLIKTRYVDENEIARFDPDHLSFFNVNTQDDLAKARLLMRRRNQLSAVDEDESQ